MNRNVNNLRIRILNVMSLPDAFHLVDQIFIVRFLRPASDRISEGTWMSRFWQAGGAIKTYRNRPPSLFLSLLQA